MGRVNSGTRPNNGLNLKVEAERFGCSLLYSQQCILASTASFSKTFEVLVILNNVIIERLTPNRHSHPGALPPIRTCSSITYILQNAPVHLTEIVKVADSESIDDWYWEKKRRCVEAQKKVRGKHNRQTRKDELEWMKGRRKKMGAWILDLYSRHMSAGWTAE